ncbi:MAG: hypothetical protein GYA12_08420 [Chloroflexi bacterium]|jgi:hypothetical protein|nr:hypothetical protein [Chloroflexota bacterium]
MPNSWYPEGIRNIEKWNVPSCRRCNEELGEIEERLLTTLGLCLDPLDENSSGIPDKVLRSVNELMGKDIRDISARRKKRELVLSNISILTDLPKQGLLPNFGPISDFNYNFYPVMYVEDADIKRFAEKVVRGIAYISNHSYIDIDYEIEHYVVDEIKMKKYISDLIQYGEIFKRESAFIVRRLLAEDDKVGGLYFIEIWGRFKFFVSVIPKSKFGSLSFL